MTTFFCLVVLEVFTLATLKIILMYACKLRWRASVVRVVAVSCCQLELG